ncbi:hypothetical protein [Pseudomonas sp. RT6P73]
MSNLNEQRQKLAHLYIVDALPNIPGGQPNILPLEALYKPLKLAVPQFPSLPDHMEVVLQLHIGMVGLPSSPASTYAFETPIDPALFPFPVQIEPARFHAEGVYEVFYQLIIGGNTSGPSQTNHFTVDRTAPNAGQPPPRAVWPEEIMKKGITSAYLAAHNDEVVVTVERYLDQQPGDLIRFFLGDVVSDPVLIKKVHDADSATTLIISGDIVRAVGSGARLAFHTLADRAGNVGPSSQPLRIDILL